MTLAPLFRPVPSRALVLAAIAPALSGCVALDVAILVGQMHQSAWQYRQRHEQVRPAPAIVPNAAPSPSARQELPPSCQR